MPITFITPSPWPFYASRRLTTIGTPGRANRTEHIQTCPSTIYGAKKFSFKISRRKLSNGNYRCFLMIRNAGSSKISITKLFHPPMCDAREDCRAKSKTFCSHTLPNFPAHLSKLTYFLSKVHVSFLHFLLCTDEASFIQKSFHPASLVMKDLCSHM